MSNQEHAEFSPSRLSRIIACPGSVALIKANNIQSKSNIYAEQGTKLHEYTHKALEFGNTEFGDLNDDEKFLVNECIDYFNILMQTKSPEVTRTKFEQLVKLESWGIPEVWGTSDAIIIDPIKRHLDVIDWKFGSGVQVYAKENSQLLAYAAGVTHWPVKYPIQTITIHVVQPALDHYDTWDIDIEYLYNWVHSTLAEAIRGSMSEPPIFNPGVEQCRFCEAAKAAKCDVLYQKVQADAAKIFEHAKLKAQIGPKDIMNLLELFPLVEKIAKGYRLYIEEEFLHGRGKLFPKFKLVRGRANRKWRDEKQVISWLNQYTEIENIFNSKLCSPSQIEKLDKTLKRNQIFQGLYEKPEGKTSLVSITDKRPAVNTISTATDAFSDIEFPDILG